MFDKNVIFDVGRATQAAALACFRQIGRGNKIAADKVAVDSLRSVLNTINIKGTVVIGEGERDKAPMLYIGERVGTGNGMEVDIALDPLEGTTPCANGMGGSMSVVTLAEKGNFLHAPDIYMDKIAVGGGLPNGIIGFDKTPKDNIKEVAKAKGISVQDVTLCTLRRDRHAHIVDDARSLGAKVVFMDDGDVAGIVATTLDKKARSIIPPAQHAIDIYMGTGGAPEGVIAASALQCLGGQMQARLVPKDAAEIARCEKYNIKNFDTIYTLDDLARGNIVFCATGITDGILAKGVRHLGTSMLTHTVMICSQKPAVLQSLYTQHALNSA